MKESTGELGGTVVVIIALIVLVGIIRAFGPTLKGWVEDKFKDLTESTIVTPIEDSFLR